jgi:multicomponent Na+:H+ antiporter subunit D
MNAPLSALLAVDWIPWVIGLPLTYAMAAFLFGARAGRMLALPALGLSLLAAVGLAARVLMQGPQHHLVGGWGAPLGIGLHADGLACIMLLMTAAIGLFTGWYARHYFTRADSGATYFWPLAGFLLGAMNALYLSADVFNLYVTLELLGLAAVGLVALTGGAAALAAALRYLLAALAGSLFYLMGVALLYGAHGTLALAELGALVTPGPPAWTVIALMTLGLALKTALFPLHFWLPPAHGGAATPVSALLSALVVKASFYLLLRLWFEVFAPAVTMPAAQLLGVLGAGAILWGSWLALQQQKVKMIVAYSTVAQVGYLFLLFPLAAYAPGVAGRLERWRVPGAVACVSPRPRCSSPPAPWCWHRAATTSTSSMASARNCRWSFIHLCTGRHIAHGPAALGRLHRQVAAAQGRARGRAVVVGGGHDPGGLLTAAYLFRVLRHAFLHARRGKQFRAVPPALEYSAFALALASLATRCCRARLRAARRRAGAAVRHAVGRAVAAHHGLRHRLPGGLAAPQPRFFGFFSLCVTATGRHRAGRQPVHVLHLLRAADARDLSAGRAPRHRKALRAGNVYLGLHAGGGGVLLAGVVWLYACVGNVDFAPRRRARRPPGPNSHGALVGDLRAAGRRARREGRARAAARLAAGAMVAPAPVSRAAARGRRGQGRRLRHRARVYDVYGVEFAAGSGCWRRWRSWRR